MKYLIRTLKILLAIPALLFIVIGFYISIIMGIITGPITYIITGDYPNITKGTFVYKETCLNAFNKLDNFLEKKKWK